jgi:hypothetical protein
MLAEQLGLEIVATNLPVETLVVEKAKYIVPFCLSVCMNRVDDQ